MTDIYPIGTPYLHIVNPFDPESSSYFGIVIGGPIVKIELGDGIYYEVEHFASNSKYWNPRVPTTYMRHNILTCAVHNYENYIKDIERERTSKNR